MPNCFLDFLAAIPVKKPNVCTVIIEPIRKNWPMTPSNELRKWMPMLLLRMVANIHNTIVPYVV